MTRAENIISGEFVVYT